MILPKSSETLQHVAVLGSGMAGATVAHQLADSGFCRVTVFECGIGVGGRMSTRVTRDEHKFAFDHGAQYIGQPKTDAFRSVIQHWQELGIVKEWNGQFAQVDAKSEMPALSLEPPSKAHYVGCPAMNAISKHLLDHQNIDVVLQTRAIAAYNHDTKKWSLKTHGDAAEPLGEFDWLVASDRLSASSHREDLSEAFLSSFRSHVEPIESVPILTLMLALESRLTCIPYNGIRFEEGGEFGSLGWMARDTSKPGRERTDGRECWVIQSGPQAAQRVLQSIAGGTSIREKPRELVREKAKEILMEDFLKAVPRLASTNDKDEILIPPTASVVGHRWAAAFPSIPSQQIDENELCWADESSSRHFVACGDYFGKNTGRVEGAFLSGQAAANTILAVMAQTEETAATRR